MYVPLIADGLVHRTGNLDVDFAQDIWLLLLLLLTTTCRVASRLLGCPPLAFWIVHVPSAALYTSRLKLFLCRADLLSDEFLRVVVREALMLPYRACLMFHHCWHLCLQATLLRLLAPPTYVFREK